MMVVLAMQSFRRFAVCYKVLTVEWIPNGHTRRKISLCLNCLAVRGRREDGKVKGKQDAMCAMASPPSQYLGRVANYLSICNGQRRWDVSCDVRTYKSTLRYNPEDEHWQIMAVLMGSVMDKMALRWILVSGLRFSPVDFLFTSLRQHFTLICAIFKVKGCWYSRPIWRCIP
jgi:hypothetical protein